MGAWLIQESGIFKLGFRWPPGRAGKLFKRSLKTTDEGKAKILLGRANANLSDLELGRLELPADADILTFLLTDGRKTTAKPRPIATLAKVCEEYLASLPQGAKAETTLATEQVHIRHFRSVLGDGRSFRALTTADLQEYVSKRSRAKGRRGEPVKGGTIEKEMGTFSALWSWAAQRGIVEGPFPANGLQFPKDDDKPHFQTRDEIERQITRGGLSPEQIAVLWECLYLRVQEVEAILSHVKKAAQPFLYPMFCFTAYTGARRSEILRSQIEDFDFDRRMVTIREKKKSKEKKLTFRQVPISNVLAAIMKAWFAKHPGGNLTICERASESVSPQMAHFWFQEAIKGSGWENKMRGWHVFRHSFASNCASKGIDQRMIDKWMGHTTEEMRKRYQHLFPDDQHKALALVFG